MSLIDACERGWIPDPLARFGMRGLIRQRLWEEGAYALVSNRAERRQPGFLDELRRGAIAESTGDANEQHYEVPAAFYETALGPRLKYSCCWFNQRDDSLAVAEEAMLRLTCERAGIEDGMDVLDLGCGWGSVSLWLAEHYPQCRILAVSNSSGQRAHIEARAEAAGFSNLEVITCDINDFDTERRFDRVVSVEMFEHMRNWEALLEKVTSWFANDDARLFVHIFCHRDLGYLYEDQGDADWMSRHFFTGGIMPRFDIFRHFPQQVAVDQEWWVNGRHYEHTSNAWLRELDAHRVRAGDIFNAAYGPDEATLWVQRWRMFFMAVAELFGIGGGDVYGVGHYLLRRTV